MGPQEFKKWREENLPLVTRAPTNVKDPANIPNYPYGDMVNNPPHYTRGPKGIEALDVIEEIQCYNIAAAMKYLWRVGFGGKSNDVEDLEKAVFYLQREIKRRKNDERR